MNKKIVNRKSQIINLLVLVFLIAFADKTYSFAPPGTGGDEPIDSTPRDLIKNVTDREIFSKSSINRSIKAGKKILKQEPKSFLLSLIKNLPDYDFELSRSEVSKDISVYHFQQTYKKLPVFGGEVLVRISKKEKSVLLTGYFFKDIKTPVEPVYRILTLKKIIKKLLKGGAPEGPTQLGILPADDEYYLSQRIRTVKNVAEDYIFYMDALTSSVLRAFNQVEAVGN